MASLPLDVPNISHAEMQAFHAAHFSPEAISGFHSTFLRPDPNVDGKAASARPDGSDELWHDEEEEYYEEDDGLGYYPDGVKRTLTDEQIAIFRHSELEALRRAEELATSVGRKRRASEATPDTEEGEIDDADGAGTELTSGAAASENTTRKRKKKNKNKRRNGGNRNQMEEKPDLRKRTWDVVATGLESLDYDEM